MPAYSYEALDAAGKAQTGMLAAENAKAALAIARPGSGATAGGGAGRQRADGRCFALGLALGLALRQEAFRQRFDAGLLGVPLIGRVARGYNASRFAGTLAMLANAGVPILKALQAAAKTLGNRALRADALEALVQVREGAPLAAALAAKKRFPGLLARFARLGEQTGQLPQMLDRAAKQLSGEVQRRVIALATLLAPILIVVMGLVVMLNRRLRADGGGRHAARLDPHAGRRERADQRRPCQWLRADARRWRAPGGCGHHLAGRSAARHARLSLLR